MTPPHVFNVVGRAEVFLAVVAAFVGVAVELQVIVATVVVGEQRTVSGNCSCQESLQRVLSSVRNNLEAKPPGISFQCSSYQCLVSVLLFAKEALVHLDNTGELGCGNRQALPESPISAPYCGVADTRHQACRTWTLAVLEAPQQQKDLAVGQVAAPEPGSGLWPHLGPADLTPTVFPFPGEFVATVLASCFVGKQLASPGIFARLVIGTVLS